MRLVLKASRHHHQYIEDANVSYIEDDGNILAWSLEFKPIDKPTYIQHLYTRVKHRKQGMGRELASHARKKYSSLAGHYDTDTYRHVGTDYISFYSYGKFRDKNYPLPSPHL